MALPWGNREDGTGRGAALVLVALALALAGHAAWYVDVDASSSPYLPQGAADAREAVTRAFPNATPPTVHVVLEAEDDESVLTPDVLTALAGLRNRISSDPATAPVLARERPIASVLGVLEPHLEGSPGEWDETDLDRALANATGTPEGRRAVAAYLDVGARVTGPDPAAAATTLVVRLAAPAPEDALANAQDGIAGFADDVTAAELDVSTTGPALRDEAARSLPGLWLPLATLVLVPLAALLAGARLPEVPAWLLTYEAAAGAGLLGAWALDHATPLSLWAAHAGAALGLVVLAARSSASSDAGPGWRWLLPVVPLFALAGWTPAGAGALAGVAGLAALSPAILASRDSPVLSLAPRWSPETGLGRWRERLPALAGPVAVLVLGGALVATAGLPTQASGGWHGSLPGGTTAGQADQAIDHHFGGTGPGAQLAIAAWGPVEEPGFAAALHETSSRLEQLTLAASEGSVETVLTLARDWATDDRERDASDRYDPAFARAWANATDARGVPTRDVDRLLTQLRELDPDATRARLASDPSQRGGAALLRQQVSITDVIPRPSTAVEAAVQPLVAASDSVAEGGSALDDPRAEAALSAGLGPAAALLVLASALAGALWRGRTDASTGLGVAVGALAGAIGPQIVVLAGALDAPARPGTFVTAAWVGGLALAISLPSTDEEDTGVDATIARLGLAVAPFALAAILATATAPAGALRAGGLVLGAGALLVAVVLPVAVPGLAAEARSVPGKTPASDRDEAPVNAHTRCPSCQRPTATGATRCQGCGRWNLVEACPAHPDAIEGRCAACGQKLGAPRFD